jgi:hypothetical protein
VEASSALSVFPIPRSRTSVVVGVLGLLACGGFAFLLALLGILPFFDAEEADVPVAARVVALAFSAGIAWLGVWILRYSMGSTRGEVRVEGDRLVIEHTDTFKAPLVVPREAVRVAQVDASGDGGVGEDARIAKHGDQTLRWAALPFVSSHEGLEAPNVGLLFQHPIEVPEVRHARLHGPLPGEALAGVRLRVKDPAAFADALSAWRCVRDPNQADAAHADRLLGDWHSHKPQGARRPLWLNRVAKNCWLMVPASLILPWLIVLSAAGALLLIYNRRHTGWLLLLANAASFAVAYLIRQGV